jgi:4-amino-4-deoxy-L-arabinose transferase-like glycosyltransferase
VTISLHRLHPAIRIAILVICLSLLAARLFTLTADFPAGIDWSADLYTDEGWYAGGAINQYLTGSWYVPGDLNTAINFPVMPLIDLVNFHLFGLSLAVDRALTVFLTACLIFLSFLVTRKYAGETAAWLCAGLLSLNFFLFGFSKLAILEIPMLTLVLLAVWWISHQPAMHSPNAIVLAVIFSLALLTKASAAFALPILLLLIWLKPGKLRSKIIPILVFLAGVGILYGGYILVVLHFYPQDYLSYNEYSMAPRITWSLSYLVYILARTVWNGKVIDPVMFFATIGLAPFGLVLFRRFRQNPLVQACILWLVVQTIILATRGYLPPRYYLLFLVPVTMLFSILITQGVDDLKPLWDIRISLLKKVASHLAALQAATRRLFPITLVAAVSLFNLVQVVGYLESPKYTYVQMVADIQQRILGSGETRPVLLGAIAQTMSIELHIPTVNIQYGTQDLLWKLDQYHPEFYVALGSEGKARAVISQVYTLELLATYNVLGNYYGGDPVFIYRLVPNQ